jgi:hypothetical protein
MADTNAAPPQAPPPSPELARLQPLAGRWRIHGRTEKSILGPPVPVSSSEEFFWLDGGYFLVQTYRTEFGDEPIQTGVNYWFYDDTAAKFRIIFFSNNGPYTEEGNRYDGEVADGALTFTGPARFQYDLDDSGRIRLNEDSTVTVRWWLRDENGTFQPWMTNVCTRG